MATRPGWRHWALGARLGSDAAALAPLLAALGRREERAIFLSHTHFDHCVDAAAVARATGSRVHGGNSVRILMEYSGAGGHYAAMGEGETARVGDFRITAVAREHPRILSLGSFLPGRIREPFGGRFYQYREGEVLCFHVEHPSGSVLVDQGSHFPAANAALAGRVDCYFVGVANKVSVEDLVDRNIGVIGPRLAVPLHFDWFMSKPRRGQGRLPGAQLDRIGARLASRAPETRWLVPELHREMSLGEPAAQK